MVFVARMVPELKVYGVVAANSLTRPPASWTRKKTGRSIPGMERAFEKTVIAAAGNIGEVQGSGPWSANALGQGKQRLEMFQDRFQVVFNGIGEPRSQQGIFNCFG